MLKSQQSRGTRAAQEEYAHNQFELDQDQQNEDVHEEESPLGLKDLPSLQGSIKEDNAAKQSAKYFDEEPLGKMHTEKNVAKEIEDEYELVDIRQQEQQQTDQLANFKRSRYT